MKSYSKLYIFIIIIAFTITFSPILTTYSSTTEEFVADYRSTDFGIALDDIAKEVRGYAIVIIALSAVATASLFMLTSINPRLRDWGKAALGGLVLGIAMLVLSTDIGRLIFGIIKLNNPDIVPNEHGLSPFDIVINQEIKQNDVTWFDPSKNTGGNLSTGDLGPGNIISGGETTPDTGPGTISGTGSDSGTGTGSGSGTGSGYPIDNNDHKLVDDDIHGYNSTSIVIHSSQNGQESKNYIPASVENMVISHNLKKNTKYYDLSTGQLANGYTMEVYNSSNTDGMPNDGYLILTGWLKAIYSSDNGQVQITSDHIKITPYAITCQSFYNDDIMDYTKHKDDFLNSATIALKYGNKEYSIQPYDCNIIQNDTKTYEGAKPDDENMRTILDSNGFTLHYIINGYDTPVFHKGNLINMGESKNGVLKKVGQYGVSAATNSGISGYRFDNSKSTKAGEGDLFTGKLFFTDWYTATYIGDNGTTIPAKDVHIYGTYLINDYINPGKTYLTEIAVEIDYNGKTYRLAKTDRDGREQDDDFWILAEHNLFDMVRKSNKDDEICQMPVKGAEDNNFGAKITKDTTKIASKNLQTLYKSNQYNKKGQEAYTNISIWFDGWLQAHAYNHDNGERYPIRFSNVTYVKEDGSQCLANNTKTVLKMKIGRDIYILKDYAKGKWEYSYQLDSWDRSWD